MSTMERSIRSTPAKPRYIPSSIREKSAYKNGPHRLIFNMRPNKAYHDAVALDGSTQLFPFTTGSRYIGTWKDNKKHGFGTLTLVNGCKYEGEFQEDKRHGKGTYWVKEGASHRKLYAGDWKYDLKDGFGVFYYKDSSKYEGEWRAGRRHGRGMMMYANGDVFEGDWAEGERSGLGILRTECGDRFEGSWMGGKKEGPGTYFFVSTGKMYEGEWADGIAKCGQLKDTAPEFMAHGEVVTEPFTMPNLELLRPDDVVADSITHVRQDRIVRSSSSSSAQHGEEGDDRIFSDRELDLMRKVFAEHEEEEGRGLVRCDEVAAMLSDMGVAVSEEWLLALFDSLGVDVGSTRMSFSEVVDLTAIVLQSGPPPAEEEEVGYESGERGVDAAGEACESDG